MSSLKLFLFGPPCLERDGVPLEFDTRKNIALVAYLAVTGHSHTREALITLLWPELEPSRARAGLRRNLSVLRKALGGEWLVVDRETVGLDPSADLWFDVNQFRRLLHAWQGHGPPESAVCPECLTALAEAVELYRGDFLAGFGLRDSLGFDEWQFFQAESLRQELASALERLVRGHSVRGAYESAIPYARRWLALDPLREPVHRHLMQLYAHTGQRAAALRQYQECVRILEAELSLPPSEETMSLYEQIRTRPADREEPLALAPQPRHNLPAQPTLFVGREVVLAEIKDLLQYPACRLLTLVGPGGSGKTRLALEAAAAQIDNYAHGVFFVSLAPLDSVEAIVPTVAEALGFSFYKGVELQQQLLDYLRQKAMLLIMDNYEHLLACPEHNRREGTGLVTEILRTAPEVKILATSRARLNVGGEHRFHVGGMDFPKPTSVATESVGDVGQYSAVRLFLQGARRALPGFALTDENLSGVVQICRLVEGMPLCIRLAAAWVEMLTPAEIAAEIGQSLDFLETDRRDVPQRQRSMRAAFDHSWRLLTERERKVLGGLSVFRGDFTREAAQQVTGGSLRELMALVNKSLLHRAPMGRYEVHELLRQYVAEKLDRSPAASQAVRDRHSAYYAAALQQWAADLRGSQQQLALAEIEADSENARAAWNWALERGQVERLEQSMDGLCRFYEWRGRYPAVIAAAQAATHLGHAVQNLSIEAVGYLWWGRALRHQGDYKEASTQLDQALARARAAQLRQVEADTLRTYGLVYWHQGGYDKARANFEQAWHICREIGDQRGAGDALNCLGAVSRHQSDYTGASTYYEQALRIYHEIGDRQGEGIVLDNLGFVSHCQGDYAGAKTYFELSLRISREIGDPEVEGDVLAYLGLLSHHLGDDEAARKYSQQALLIAQDLGDRRTQGYALTNLGHALVGLGRLVEAADAYRQALGLRRELGQSNLAMEPLAGLARVSLAQGDLPQRQVEEILSHLENQTPSTALRLRSGQGSGHGLDGTDEPFWVYLTCYRVLCANQDPRAEAILGTAHSLLQEQAAKISDEELRRSFLENVATHREVMCEFVKMSSGLIAGAKAY